MYFIYLVPSGFFIFEFIVMFLLGLGVIDNMLDPQTIITMHCGFWAIAVASLITAIYIFIKARRLLKESKNSTQIIDVGELFSSSVFYIHIGVATILFIVVSLLLGGADGGVMNEIFWFLKLFLFTVISMFFSFVSCALAMGIMKAICFFVNRRIKNQQK